jgi:hypothetical protein
MIGIGRDVIFWYFKYGGWRFVAKLVGWVGEEIANQALFEFLQPIITPPTHHTFGVSMIIQKD